MGGLHLNKITQHVSAKLLVKCSNMDLSLSVQISTFREKLLTSGMNFIYSMALPVPNATQSSLSSLVDERANWGAKGVVLPYRHSFILRGDDQRTPSNWIRVKAALFWTPCCIFTYPLSYFPLRLLPLLLAPKSLFSLILLLFLS